MNWTKFLTYGDSQQNAFETLSNQLFERYLRKTYPQDLTKFRVINGSGGDGGIEAYGELKSGEIIAVQAKWFLTSLNDSQIGQIRNSILTAKKLRPQIKKYFISIPHNVNSLKIGRGNKPTKNHEENRLNELVDEIFSQYSDLELVWWFDNELLSELQSPGNEGIHKYWFDKEIISFDYLSNHFKLQKAGWLHERYIPELHGQGLIHKEYQKLCFAEEYRENLLNLLNSALNDIRFCLDHLDQFITINTTDPTINDDLNLIKTNLTRFSDEFLLAYTAAKEGNDQFQLGEIAEVNLWQTILKLKKLEPSNIQKNILPRLISSMEEVHRYDLLEFSRNIGYNFKQSIRLIIGEPGTGKTHGLANCCELYLNQRSPAIIIQSKGVSNSNWTDILANSLQLPGWNKEDIFSALESLALHNDVLKALTGKPGEELTSECTKVLICVDGLDEDMEHEDEWYARIRECEELVLQYPKLRFFFTARKYFYDSSKIPLRGIFEDVFLPREGDVRIFKIAPLYFSKEHYNITLSSYSIIRGIDSLFALRLFCEEYRDRAITEVDEIITVSRDLINLKVDKINQEYSTTINNKLGATRNPILDALVIIAKHFYSNHEIEHKELVELITPSVTYLNIADIDLLLDYLSDNGFLIRSERIENSSFLVKKSFIYNITYQSLIEHIISEDIYHQIRTGALSRIPDFLHKRMLMPLEHPGEDYFVGKYASPNLKIIQNIVTNLLLDTGQLIGEDDFLKEGFSTREISMLQLMALSKAPYDVSIKYKSKIDNLILSGSYNLYQVLKYLVLPSCHMTDNAFGSEYLHDILSNISSTFEKDKLWSGPDSYEAPNSTQSEDEENYSETASTVLVEFGLDAIGALDDNSINQLPLISAWGLSTLDQKLRNDIRVSLTDWAIKNPSEFLLLLQKMKDCNDPQILEDLASVSLGVASRLKDVEPLSALAKWAIENIFKNLQVHRNIIARQGFRAIVERAFQFGAVTKEEVELCRPAPMKEVVILPFEVDLVYTGQGECYPIVHDLAWYVIGNAYDNFLEYPSSFDGGIGDNDCVEAKTLLDEYRKAYNDPNIYANTWAMSVAIAYIRSLGLKRTEGNGFTQASHGSKSKVFTFEEKYTWLAVRYIQGYLSDYIPLENSNGERVFIKDYTSISDIPNPAESIDITVADWGFFGKKEWIIKEVLSKELVITGDINSAIKDWVNEEPVFDLDRWLKFDSSDFNLSQDNRDWTAIFNFTALHDSKQYCYSYISLTACLIKKIDLASLQEIINTDPDSLHFTDNITNLHSSPSTDTYCNPTDIVWMSWIGEDESTETFYDRISSEKKSLFHSITEITQNGINGESHVTLPSKLLRGLLKCVEYRDGMLRNSEGNILAFNHKISDGSFKDSQEIVVVDSDALNKVLQEFDYEIIWFVELFKKKNPLNESLDKDFHVQKTRKYFVWRDNTDMRMIKFWDEWFSNARDK